jgi:prepilin-type N-terminal cleavage/methylation domain-containing protein
MLKKNQRGFTIIEVLIVLAIAGLIMLIVFMAVPALQRNSRNTQRKNDVSALLSTYSEYISNNGGKVPATCYGSSTTCFVREAKLSYYNNESSNVVFNNTGATATPRAAITNLDVVRIFTNAKCGAGGSGVATNASSRSIIALYAVETSGNPSSQCQES